MVVKFISKALKRDQKHLVVRKTDDELTRFNKQVRRQQDRERYRKALEEEEERRRKGLNVEEKKQLYFAQIEALPETVYNKQQIADS